MKNLLYKELKLSIHKFFYILPFLLALLMFIPAWIFILVFMYFFWISIINICAGYTAREDNSFTAMLPVSKRDIVKSKIAAISIIELIHLVSGIVMGVIHNLLYGTPNFFMDMNLAFFSAMFVMFAIFNVIFMPLYFKSAYFYGKPVIYGVAATLFYGFILEYGTLRYSFMNSIFEGGMGTQWIVAIVSLVVTIGLMVIAVNRSIRNFERIS